jgi:hypothetical protein
MTGGEIKLNGFLDERNIGLWNELQTCYQFKLEESTNQEASCYIAEQTAIFYLPLLSPSPEALAHELLHVYLHSKKVNLDVAIMRKINSSNILTRIFSPPLLEHMGNSLNHIKMLPYFLRLGYNKENFLYDHTVNKCTGGELKLIKGNYKVRNQYSCDAIDLYVGKFFAVKADTNQDYDYSQCLKELNKIDDRLFSILSKVLNSWEIFDIENTEASYSPIADQFYIDLKNWMTNKSFV